MKKRKNNCNENSLAKVYQFSWKMSLLLIYHQPFVKKTFNQTMHNEKLFITHHLITNVKEMIE